MAIFIALLLSAIVSAVGLRYLQTLWVYFLVTSLLPPMLMIGGDAVWNRGVDAWDHIVFVVLLLIAFGVSVVVRVASRLLYRRTEEPTQKSETTSN
jgi:hypothetical protein